MISRESLWQSQKADKQTEDIIRWAENFVQDAKGGSFISSRSTTIRVPGLTEEAFERSKKYVGNHGYRLIRLKSDEIMLCW